MILAFLSIWLKQKSTRFRKNNAGLSSTGGCIFYLGKTDSFLPLPKVKLFVGHIYISEPRQTQKDRAYRYNSCFFWISFLHGFMKYSQYNWVEDTRHQHVGHSNWGYLELKKESYLAAPRTQIMFDLNIL